MKHKNTNASSGELACQHLRDHPTQQIEAQQRSRGAPAAAHFSGRLDWEKPRTSPSCPFGFVTPRFSSFQLVSVDFTSFQLISDNKSAASGLSCRGRKTSVHFGQTPGSFRNFFPLSLCYLVCHHALAVCEDSAPNNHFMPVYRALSKIIGFPNSPAPRPGRAEIFAETTLKLAETSQHLLRHFSLLPTTYKNFSPENAETAKLLRH